MTPRERFKALARILCPELTEAELEELAKDADEYAAHLIERYARPPVWEEGVAS
jgi:hypothetical protein